jgi:hypothetical protein
MQAIIVVADKWTHFDTCSILPTLQHVCTTEHGNNCLLQHSRSLRLIYVQFIAILMTTNCTHQLARHSVISCRRILIFWLFSLQMLEKCAYLRCTVCLSVCPSGTVAWPSPSQRCCRNCDTLGKWVCVVSVAPDIPTTSSACISGLSGPFC